MFVKFIIYCYKILTIIFYRYGRKLWFLLPPASDIYSNIPPLLWSSKMDTTSSSDQEKYYPYPLPGEKNEMNVISSQLCQYTQVSGDILFVPSLYTHQVAFI